MSEIAPQQQKQTRKRDAVILTLPVLSSNHYHLYCMFYVSVIERAQIPLWILTKKKQLYPLETAGYLTCVKQ